MTSKQRFAFTQKTNSLGEISFSPYLPFNLSSTNNSILVSGLLDTGASVNVLPYEIGLQLGLDWDNYNISVTLAGNLAECSAKGVILSATVDRFASVTLAFAWTQSQNIPLLLGRVNFFQEFDVCFYGSQSAFDIAPKSQ
jgi:hypothetical protein